MSADLLDYLAASSTIDNCFALGDLEGTSYVAGLVGRLQGTVTDCYSLSKVTGSTNVGGLCGSNGTVNTSFYNLDTCGVSANGYGTAVYTADMKAKATYTTSAVGWDFTGETTNGTNDYWNIDSYRVVNNGYPYLDGMQP